MAAEKPQTAPEEPVDAEIVRDGPEPAPELHEAVEDALASTDMVVADPRDEQQVYVAMDAHDAARLVDRLTTQAQEQNLGKRWIYEFRNGNDVVRGLTVDAVEDIVQQMNWSGKCAIGVLPDTMRAELIAGEDDEQEWTVTIAAEDARTGSRMMGTSQEPQRMKLKGGKRKFDKFAKGKALSKAQRNAMESFIPEVVKLTLIAMAAGNANLVERIETADEAAIRELPPPLDTPEAEALRRRMDAVYDEIRGLGGGRGAVLLTPGRFNGAKATSQHSMSMMESTLAWLEQRRDEIREQLTDTATSKEST